MSSNEIPVNYVFPTFSRRTIRLFCNAGWAAVPTWTEYYSVPSDKILKIKKVIITSGNGNFPLNNAGLFFQDSAGNEISSFARADGAANYADTIYDFDDKLVLMGGDRIRSLSNNGVGVGAFEYYLVFGTEEQNPDLYPQMNTETRSLY